MRLKCKSLERRKEIQGFSRKERGAPHAGRSNPSIDAGMAPQEPPGTCGEALGISVDSVATKVPLCSEGTVR